MKRMGIRTTKQISVYLLPEHIKKLDDLVKKGLYGSRNEAIRVAITDLLKAEAVFAVQVSDNMLYRIDRAARREVRGIRIKGGDCEW